MPEIAYEDHELPPWGKTTAPPSELAVEMCIQAAEALGGGLNPQPMCEPERLEFEWHDGSVRIASSCSCGEPMVLALPYNDGRGYARVCMRCDAANLFPRLA